MIKQFILNLKCVREHVQEKIKNAEVDFHLKNFKVAQKDILETMRDDLDKEAELLCKQKLNDLLSPADLHKIVTFDSRKGIIFIGGEKVDEGRLSNLKSEAEFFLESDLWHILYESPKELASRAMFVSGETLADMQKGKSILYTLSTQNNIIQTFKKYVGKTPDKNKP